MPFKGESGKRESETGPLSSNLYYLLSQLLFKLTTNPAWSLTMLDLFTCYNHVVFHLPKPLSTFPNTENLSALVLCLTCNATNVWKKTSSQLIYIRIKRSHNFYLFPTTRKTNTKNVKNRIHMLLFLHYFLKNGIIALRFQYVVPLLKGQRMVLYQLFSNRKHSCLLAKQKAVLKIAKDCYST